MADVVDVVLKAAHVVVEEVADVDEEVVQLVDVAEEVVQELIDLTEEWTVVLYLSSHDAFGNQDLSYLKMASDYWSSHQVVELLRSVSVLR